MKSSDFSDLRQGFPAQRNVLLETEEEKISSVVIKVVKLEFHVPKCNHQKQQEKCPDS